MARIVQARNVILKLKGKTVDLFNGDELPDGVPESEVERLDSLDALVPVEAAEPAAEPEPVEFDLATASDEAVASWVSSSTIEDIDTAVGGDKKLAARVLAAEQARGGDARKTLVEKLEELVTAS